MQKNVISCNAPNFHWSRKIAHGSVLLLGSLPDRPAAAYKTRQLNSSAEKQIPANLRGLIRYFVGCRTIGTGAVIGGDNEVVSQSAYQIRHRCCGRIPESGNLRIDSAEQSPM